jgi:hypothetical protein
MDENGMKLELEKCGQNVPVSYWKTSLLMCDLSTAYVREAIEWAVMELNTQLGVIPGGPTSQL